jgi:hypothetical protein
MRKGLRVAGLDPHGWLILEYKGTQIRSQGDLHILDFPAHHAHGAAAPDARHWMRVVDEWVESQG